MKNFTLFISLLYLLNCQSQIVNIPDLNFKAALISHNPTIDTNDDGEIQVVEAESFTGIISVSGKNISDLTGIENFINIVRLGCSVNQLTNLDLTNNIALEILTCDYNQLQYIDLTNNVALEVLSCEDNQLQYLNLSNNVALRHFHCLNNQLNCLNLRNGHIYGMDFMAANNPDLQCIEILPSDIDSTFHLELYQDVVIDTSYCCSTSIQEESINKLHAFPNPTKDMIYLKRMSGDREENSITIMDIRGRILQTINSQGNCDLDISAYNRGIYFVRITGRNNSQTIKVIKE